MIETANENYVCSSCLDYSYVRFDCCCDERYTLCEDCDRYVIRDYAENAHDECGHEHAICSDCATHYERCEDCGRLFRSGVLKDGLCPECVEKAVAREGTA